jgi:hypothetical protein
MHCISSQGWCCSSIFGFAHILYSIKNQPGLWDGSDSKSLTVMLTGHRLKSVLGHLACWDMALPHLKRLPFLTSGSFLVS